jgi:hypothetical protein
LDTGILSEWQQRMGVGERQSQTPVPCRDLGEGRRAYAVAHEDGGRAGWQVEHGRTARQPGRLDAVVEQRTIEVKVK